MYLALQTTATELLPAKASPTNFPSLSTGLPLSPLSRKGWLTREDVVNTLPLDKLRKELVKKREKAAR